MQKELNIFTSMHLCGLDHPLLVLVAHWLRTIVFCSCS